MENINKKFQIFHKIFSISHFLKKRSKNFLKDFRVTEAEARIIFLIGIYGNGQINIHRLINISKIHKSTVRQKIKPLIEQNFLKIDNCKYDKREKKVYFTNKGKSLFREIYDINITYQKKVFSNFNEGEISELLTLLNKLEL